MSRARKGSPRGQPPIMELQHSFIKGCHPMRRPEPFPVMLVRRVDRLPCPAPPATRGRGQPRHYAALGAVFIYQFLVVVAYQQGATPRVGLKAFLKAA